MDMIFTKLPSTSCPDFHFDLLICSAWKQNCSVYVLVMFHSHFIIMMNCKMFGGLLDMETFK